MDNSMNDYSSKEDNEEETFPPEKKLLESEEIIHDLGVPPLREEGNDFSITQRLDLSSEQVSNTGRAKEGHKTEDQIPTSILPSRQKNVDEVLEWLGEDDIGIIGIKGVEGIGRTWTARHVVTQGSSCFDIVIWVNVGFGTSIRAMQMQIVDQLNLLWYSTRAPTYEELRKEISMSLEDKKFLFIFDDILYYYSYNLEDLGIPLPSLQKKSSKVLIIGSSEIDRITTDRVLSLDNLHDVEAWILFREKSGLDGSDNICELARPLLDVCKGLPLNIIRVAGSLRKFIADADQTLEAKVRKVSDMKGSLTCMGLLYEMLPSKVMKDCFLYCTVYPDYHRISVKELITSWIMEGILDGFSSLEKACDKGLFIVKDLIDRYLLYKFDENHVTMHDALKTTWRYGNEEGQDIILAKSGLRLIVPTLGLEQESFRKISLVNEKLETKFTDAPTFPTISTLLLHGDGGILPKEFSDAFFEKMQHLEVLAILQAQLSCLPSSLSDLKNLRVLVLKGCRTLGDLKYIQALQSLVVLSLSGASTLKEIPDDFFEHMHNLNALDLSNTQIQHLPISLSKLTCLRRLILRGCSQLKTMPYMNLLNVLDLSGASTLGTISDEFFNNMSNLTLLDLSGTYVDHLPSASNLSDLRYLFLRGCSMITTLSCPEAFRELKVLDLSGATAFEKFQDEPASSWNSLEILDLSDTQIIKVPPLSKCQKLRKLLLRNCSKLQKLPFFNKGIEVLDLSSSTSFEEFENEFFGEKLQILDLSKTQVVKLPSVSRCRNLRQLLVRSCLHLEEFDDNAFENLQTLQLLNLSGTKLEKLPNLSRCSNLQGLLLRNCSQLQKLPRVKELRKLKVLDLSGAVTFLQFEDEYMENCELRKLDLSKTKVVQLPLLSKCINLRKLLLRGCSNIEVLPHLEALTMLKVLDLSGSTSFMKFQDESFGQKNDLKILDLSHTKIVELPLLLGCINLCQLLLRGCLYLKTLPELKKLEKLEVLDLSGDTGFQQFQDVSFEQKPSLRILDVSETTISELPLLSGCINLCQLILRDCSNLAELPHLKALIRLEMLDLSGAASVGVEDDYLEKNCELQSLDLSRTQIVKLPSLSNCSKLCNLILRGCSNLQTLPSLEALIRLKVLDLSGATSLMEFQDESFQQNNELQILNLSDTQIVGVPCFKENNVLEMIDLSGTKVTNFSFLSNCSNLYQLLLRKCLNLGTLQDLEKLKRLEVLDLSDAQSLEIPYGILKLPHLRFLKIQNRVYLWGFDLENRMEVTKRLYQGPWDRSSSSSNLLDKTVSDADIFLYKESNSKGFNFCLCSPEEREIEDHIYLHGKEFVVSDIYYYQTRQFPQWKEPDKFFMIRGFQSLPSGIEEVLNQTELLYLKRNPFITRLSDVGAENVKTVKECWIESCDRMKSLFYKEDEEQTGRNLERLLISNLSELVSLYKGDVQTRSLSCLEHLYIECCPSLISLFSSEMKLENLKTVRIKFCDNLTTVFGDMELQESSFQNLHTMTLWKLPALRNICDGTLPYLTNLRIKGCPRLQKLPVVRDNLYIKGEQQWWDTFKGNAGATGLFTPLYTYL